jgi:hypothetical protein
MNLLNKYTTPFKLILISLACAIFTVWPNLACISWDLSHMPKAEHSAYLLFSVYRFLFFSVLIWSLIIYNLKKTDLILFKNRLIHSLFIAGIAYLIYVGISFLSGYKADCFTSTLLFQFCVVCILCTFIGHVSLLYTVQGKKEQEIEQLKTDNLQSRCEALTNQINPHFFFNSLNGLTALIRKKNEDITLAYVNKLSDVFRYILQSEKKGIVTLGEELEFVHSFRYMMEIRFANKLIFDINVGDEMMNLKIPVLSLLPIIDNVIVHNIIDSEHKMVVTIIFNDKSELVVSNPVFPKLTPPDTNGTGLKNLENRYSILMNREIRIENDGKMFRVYLPLK